MPSQRMMGKKQSMYEFYAETIGRAGDSPKKHTKSGFGPSEKLCVGQRCFDAGVIPLGSPAASTTEVRKLLSILSEAKSRRPKFKI